MIGVHELFLGTRGRKNHFNERIQFEFQIRSEDETFVLSLEKVATNVLDGILMHLVGFVDKVSALMDGEGNVGGGGGGGCGREKLILRSGVG